MGAIAEPIEIKSTPERSLIQPSLDAPSDVPSGVAGPDLADLIRSFNEVTSRLQRTHETLTSEVSRLKGELREANQQLGRAKELAALGEMAAGIAHEVRNPLGSIRLYASAIEEDLDDRPEPQRMARRIVDAVRGLDAVVSDVLTFSRELRIQREPVVISELVAWSLTSSADLAQRLNVDVRLPDEQTSAMILWCDPTLIQQALSNLVRNAMESMRDVDGERVVEITVASCQVRGPRGGSKPMISIRVRDHGPGVSDEVMRRMFNPFFTTRHTGTGLGLAIVHRIVDAHEGRVTVCNHSEGGAVVELTLPAPSAQHSDSSSEENTTHGGDS